MLPMWFSLSWSVVILALGIAVATAADSADPLLSQALHHRLVSGIKGRWTSLWEFPVQRHHTMHLAYDTVEPIGEDSDFRNDLKEYGFGITKINGSLYWSKAHRGNTSTKSTPLQASVFGERRGDDTLTWAMVRPDHTVIDRVTAFEVPKSEGEVAVEDDEAPTPDFYFPFLDSQILSSYMAFDGYRKPQPEGLSEAYIASRTSWLDLSHNAYVKAALKQITYLIKTVTGSETEMSTDDGESKQKWSSTPTEEELKRKEEALKKAVTAPSYGYVLCSVDEAIVPTRPHISPEGEQFTRSRRVMPTSDTSHFEGDTTPKSKYLTRTAVYSGRIFELKLVSDLKISASEAFNRFCSPKSKDFASTTSLTVTTVGAATSTSGITVPTFAPNATLFGKANKEDHWDLDSIVFEFGLLPHEAARFDSETPKDYAVNAESTKVLSALAKTQTDALNTINSAFANHPLLKATAPRLKHRVTFRRLFRSDDGSILGAFSNIWGTYYSTILVALGFVFFRFYVGYRYGAKKTANTRKALAVEDQKLKQKK